MNVLADFKNYAYALPIIRGLVIHMSPGRTSILIPKNRHGAVSKVSLFHAFYKGQSGEINRGRKWHQSTGINIKISRYSF
jgi:hypothetical protein